MMRQLLSAITLASIVVFARTSSGAPPDDVKAYCAGKWQEYRMQASCVQEEEQARANLSRGVSDQSIWSRCWHKWDSWRMVNFCVNEEEKAKASLQRPPSTPARTSPAVPAPPPPSLSRTPALAQPQGDAAALSACQAFVRARQRYRDGVIGVREIPSEMRIVYSHAERSGDARVREAAAALVRTTDLSPRALLNPRPDDPSIDQALDRFSDLCLNSVLAPAALPKPSIPISAEEADRQAERALQGSGIPAGKCQKKQYGTGWVTVCD